MSIRSLHIIGSKTSGGAERFFAQLTNQLHQNGHPVSAVFRPRSPLLQMVSVPVFPAALRNVWDALSMVRIRQLVRREQPDIVQTYMGRATRLTRLPKGQATVHVARLGGFYKLDGFRHAHAWVGNTGAICDYLIQGGFPANRVFHIPNFVEPVPPSTFQERMATRQAHGIPSDALVILSAGRFVDKKGFADLLQAFSHLPPTVQGRPVHLLLLGDGPLNQALRVAARQLGIGARTHWPGWQFDTAPFFAVADLFACPSHHEPLGNVILDAWNHRLAVVTTDTHGARELVENGKNALVAPCGDVRELTRRLEELLRRDSDRRSLGEEGHKRLLRDYSPQRVVAAYVDLYSRLRQDRKPDSPRYSLASRHANDD